MALLPVIRQFICLPELNRFACKHTPAGQLGDLHVPTNAGLITAILFLLVCGDQYQSRLSAGGEQRVVGGHLTGQHGIARGSGILPLL